MVSLKYMVLCISGLVLGSSASLVPFIHKCASADSACNTQSATDALPYIIKGLDNLGVKPLEPIFLKDVKAEAGELKLTFQNMKLEGTSKTIFQNVERDAEKHTTKLTLDIPVVVTGTYKMIGKIAIVDVEGEGDFSIKTDKMRFVVDIKLKDIEGPDGKKHHKITGFDFTFDPIEKVHLKFDNLFGGDKTKAEPVQKVIDESWKELTPTLGKPIVAEGITRIVETIGQFFKAVPIEDLEIV